MTPPTLLEKIGIINLWCRKERRRALEARQPNKPTPQGGKRLIDLSDQELNELYTKALEGLKNG